MKAGGDNKYHRLMEGAQWLKTGPNVSDSTRDYAQSEDSVMTGCSSARAIYANGDTTGETQILNSYPPISEGRSSPPMTLKTPDPFSSPFMVPPTLLHKVTSMSSPHHREALLSVSEGSSLCSVFGNFINSIIGAGIVGLPYTFKEGGVVLALVSITLAAWLSDYSLRLLVKTAKYAKVNTYEDLCEYCFGNKGFYFVSIAMFFFDFGAMLAFLIILGDSSEKLALAWTGRDGPNIRRLLIVLISAVLIFPLCMLRDISMLEKASAISVVTVVLICAIVVYKWVTSLPDIHHGNEITWVSMGFPSAFGTIAFAFVCQDCAFMMFNTLYRPTTRRWGILVHMALGTACVICVAFALCGYLTFRDKTSSNVLNDYAPEDPVVQVARCIYVITMALTYPISFYVTRHVIYTIIFRGPNYKSEKESSTLTHLAISIPLLLSSVGVVMIVTDLGVVMSLTGSIAAVFLAFILPAACHLQAQPSPLQFWLYKKGAWKGFRYVAPSMLLAVFGFGVMLLSTAQTIAQQMNYKLFG